MTPERKTFWTETFTAFAALWQFFEPTPERAAAYDALLADIPLEDLRPGMAWLLATTTAKEAPRPGDIREAIEGKLTWVDVWQRDQWGSIVTRNGARVSVGRKHVRIREGEEPPTLLSWGSVDDEHWEGQRPQKHEPLRLPSAITGAVERKTRPPQ